MASYHFILESSNAKTGPMPVVSTSSDSCPIACPLKGSGCYAELGMTGLHWRRLDEGVYGVDFETLQKNIYSLPHGQLWRLNVAGDLAHHNQWISASRLNGLIDANEGKRGFTYTHHLIEGNSTTAKHNRYLIRQANNQGFTVNLSANSPEHADRLMALNVGPVVTLLPENIGSKPIQTPGVNTIVQCPAVDNPSVNCSNCGLCQVVTRRSIVGFPVHGVRKNAARRIINISRG